MTTRRYNRKCTGKNAPETAIKLQSESAPCWEKGYTFTEKAYYNTRKILEECHFTWKIENFSHLGGKVGDTAKGPQFSSAENSKCKWHVIFYPSGYSEEADRAYVGLYLYLDSSPNINIHSRVEFSILDSSDKIIRCEICNFVFLARSGKQHGCRQFMNRETLLNSVADDIIKLNVMITASVAEVNEAYRLKLPEPEQKLKHDLGMLLKEKKFTDLSLIVDSKQIVQAHRAILAARSPVFAAMLEHDTLANQRSRITISGVEIETLCDLIGFIYTSHINRHETPRIMNLLRAADKYAINDLKEICEELLIATLNNANALDLLLLADKHSAAKLKEVAIDFICSNPTHFLTAGNRKLVSGVKSDILADILMTFSTRCVSSK